MFSIICNHIYFSYLTIFHFVLSHVIVCYWSGNEIESYIFVSNLLFSDREEVEEISNRLRVKLFRSSVKDNFNISEGTIFRINYLLTIIQQNTNWVFTSEDL